MEALRTRKPEEHALRTHSAQLQRQARAKSARLDNGAVAEAVFFDICELVEKIPHCALGRAMSASLTSTPAASASGGQAASSSGPPPTSALPPASPDVESDLAAGDDDPPASPGVVCSLPASPPAAPRARRGPGAPRRPRAPPRTRPTRARAAAKRQHRLRVPSYQVWSPRAARASTYDDDVRPADLGGTLSGGRSWGRWCFL